MGGGGLGTGGRIITGLLLLAHLLGGDLLGLGQLAAAHAVALFLWAERRRCQNGLLQVQVQAQGREGIRTAPANFFCAASRALSRWLPRAILISEKWTRSSAGCRSSGRGGRFALSRCVWCVVWLAWSARSVEWDFDANTEEWKAASRSPAAGWQRPGRCRRQFRAQAGRRRVFWALRRVGPSGLEMPSCSWFQQQEFSANQPTSTSCSLYSCFHSLFGPE